MRPFGTWADQLISGVPDGGVVVVDAAAARGGDVVAPWAQLRASALALGLSSSRLVVATRCPPHTSPALWAQSLAAGHPAVRALPPLRPADDAATDDDAGVDGDGDNHSPRRALVILRAQPLHRGHLMLITRALEEADEAVVVIAAAEASHSQRHPFSAGERLRMVAGATNDIADRLWLLALPTPAVPALAMAELVSGAPRCQVVVAGNPIVACMAQEAGLDVIRVEVPCRVDGAVVSATAIREGVVAGVDDVWLDARVPLSVRQALRSPWAQRRLTAVAAAEWSR